MQIRNKIKPWRHVINRSSFWGRCYLTFRWFRGFDYSRCCGQAWGPQTHRSCGSKHTVTGTRACIWLLPAKSYGIFKYVRRLKGLDFELALRSRPAPSFPHEGTFSVTTTGFDFSEHIVLVPMLRENEVDTIFPVSAHCCSSAVALKYLVSVVTVKVCGENSRQMLCSNVTATFILWNSSDYEMELNTRECCKLDYMILTIMKCVLNKKARLSLK